MEISQRLTVLAFYDTRNKCYFNNESELWLKNTSLGGWTLDNRSASRILEELEVQPTQNPTVVWFGQSLAKSH